MKKPDEWYACLKCGMGYSATFGYKSGDQCRDRSQSVELNFAGCTGRVVTSRVYGMLLRELGAQHPNSAQLTISALAFGDVTTVKDAIARLPRLREAK